MPENKSFHLLPGDLCLIGSVMSTFEKEQDRTRFQMCIDEYLLFRGKTVSVLASVLCLRGDFQFKVKPSTTKGMAQTQDNTYCIADQLYFLPSSFLLIC